MSQKPHKGKRGKRERKDKPVVAPIHEPAKSAPVHPPVIVTPGQIRQLMEDHTPPKIKYNGSFTWWSYRDGISRTVHADGLASENDVRFELNRKAVELGYKPIPTFDWFDLETWQPLRRLFEKKPQAALIYTKSGGA